MQALKCKTVVGKVRLIAAKKMDPGTVFRVRDLVNECKVHGLTEQQSRDAIRVSPRVFLNTGKRGEWKFLGFTEKKCESISRTELEKRQNELNQDEKEYLFIIRTIIEDINCWYDTDLTLDHVIALSNGGNYKPINLQILTKRENSIKNNREGFKKLSLQKQYDHIMHAICSRPYATRNDLGPINMVFKQFAFFAKSYYDGGLIINNTIIVQD